MKIELLWYNPMEQEYQLGDKRKYKELLKNSNEPQNFFLVEKFGHLTDRFKANLRSQIETLNSYGRSTRFA